MYYRIRNFLFPTHFDRRAHLLNATLLLLIVGMSTFTPIFYIASFIARDTTSARNLPLAIGIFILLVAIGLLYLMRRGYIWLSGLILLLVLFVTITSSLMLTKTSWITMAAYLLIITLSGLLMGQYAVLGFTGFTILTTFVLFWLSNGNFTFFQNDPLLLTNWVSFSFVAGLEGILLYIAINSLVRAVRSLNESNEQLQVWKASLEQRVADRTHDLELAVKVGHNIARVRDLDSLLSDAAELIRSRFNLYYVQIYLTDPTGQGLILRTGTGKVGQELTRRGHRLPFGPGSINGVAAADKRPVVVDDTQQSPLFRYNPLLPETRSEMSIPLIAGSDVLGVLDLQSSQPNSFTEDNFSTFEILAAQLAVAIQNARLFAEMEQARTEVEAQARRLVHEGWGAFLDAIRHREEIGYVYEQGKLISVEEAKRPFSEENTAEQLVIPISITGEPVGEICLEALPDKSWSAAERELVNNIAYQVAQHIENLRLLSEAEAYRLEAEEAIRRLVHEQWESFEESFELQPGFVYDQKQVKPLTENGHDTSGYQVPLQIQGETIGFLEVAEGDEATAEILQAVADRLSAHLENLRLGEQTRRALAETERLYTASQALTAVQSEQEAITTLIHNIDHTHLDKILVAQVCHGMDASCMAEVVAGWSRNEREKIPVGEMLTTVSFSVLNQIEPDEVLIINDVTTSSQLDEDSRLNLQAQGIKSLAIIPISSGQETSGWLLLEAIESAWQFTESAIQGYKTLAGQTAVVLERIRALQDAQARATREQLTREIGAKVSSFIDLEKILQTTARELSHALGASHAVIRMGVPMKNETQTNGQNQDRSE
ncbi:MAG: GAF domain-containing protein [Chloroflexi bacterium]|nr:MAG: GAF domain-containing protein [Chloroflexota bacterium]